MTLEWLGHACFRLTLADCTVILTDPFDPSVGYPQPSGEADIVTESHQHHDHNDISSLSRVGTVLAEPCDTVLGGARIYTISTFHDSEGGAKRGGNLVFVFEAEGLKLVHLGDLGHMPTEEQLARLRGVDVLLTPIGGFYTIDAETAERVRLALRPRVTIPMHFLTPVMSFPIADEKAFLAANGGVYAHTSRIELDAEHIRELPEVLVLDF